MRFRKKGQDGSAPVKTPGAPSGLPPEYVEARAFLTEISRQRRNSHFSASVGLGFDELAAHDYIETTKIREACARLAGRAGAVVIEGPSGSGKTALLRLLAYKALTEMREPAFFLEVQSSYGRAELATATGAPGLLILDNAQRNFAFAAEVLKARTGKLTVAGAHPPDYGAPPHRDGWHYSGFRIEVWAHQVVEEVLSLTVRPHLTPEAYRETERQMRFSHVDLWTLLWAIDACVEHAKRFHALSEADVLRLASDRAADWLRRALPGQLGLREVASVLLPVSTFSSFEIPVPRDFIIETYRLDAQAFAKLVAYGEIAVVNGQVALHHQKLARLYAAAIRASPDLAGLVHPSLRSDDVAPAFVELSRRHPEAMLDALARFSAGGPAHSTQALFEAPEIRHALLVALGDTEVVRRALPAISRIAADQQRLAVRVPADVLRALCAGASFIHDTEEGPQRATAAVAVGFLATFLTKDERLRAAKRLIQALDPIARYPSSEANLVAVQLFAACSTPEREAIVDELLAVALDGQPGRRAAAYGTLSAFGVAVPRSRAPAYFDAALRGLASEDKDVNDAADGPFVWAAGLIRRDEMDGIITRLLDMLPTGPVEAQDRRLRVLSELCGYCSAPMLDRVTAAHLGLGRSRDLTDLYEISSFLGVMAKTKHLRPDALREAVELTLGYSRHPRLADESSESEGAFATRCAARDMGSYAALAGHELRELIVPRLVELLEDPVESYKWGEDPMTEAADALAKHFEFMEAKEIAQCAKHIVGLFASPRGRVRAVAIWCATHIVPRAASSQQDAIFGGLMRLAGGDAWDTRDAAVEAIATWAPTMAAHLLEALGRELEAASRGRSNWDPDDAVKVTLRAVPFLAPQARGTAIALLGEYLRDPDASLRGEVMDVLTKQAATADPPLFAWIAGVVLPPRWDTQRQNWVNRARFVLANRARLDPASSRVALDLMVQGCMNPDPWGPGSASELAVEIAGERDPATAPFAEAAAVNLALSRSGHLVGRAAQIARLLPSRAPGAPPSHLPAAFSLALNAGNPLARVNAARLLIENPEFSDPTVGDDPQAVLRDVLLSALAGLPRYDRNEYSDWEQVLRAAGPAVSPALAAEIYAALEEMARCPSVLVRQTAITALREFAPSLTSALRARAAMVLAHAAAGADPHVASSAIWDLGPYLDALDPKDRSEALILVLDAPSRFARWLSREKLAVLFALRDAAPPERRAEVDALLGNWKPNEQAPETLLNS